MRTPDFWKHRNSLIAKALEPIGWLYAAGGAFRQALIKPEKVSVPVICVGNLTAGGTGKTPICISIAEHLKAKNINVHFLTRGYGGVLFDVQVDLEKHTSIDVGDEPLLLAETAPVWVDADRVAGAEMAINAGAEAIIMDDGFQNPALEKDLSLVVMDGGYGIGNGKIIPAGPLREPVKTGMKRASAMIIVGNDTKDVYRFAPKGMDIINAEFVPDEKTLQLAGQRVVAFAGIGRPEKFFNMLESMGCEVLAVHYFADHYPYAPTDIQPILDEAYSLGAIPVTTAKDSVRLPKDQRQQVNVANIKIKWENESALDTLLKDVLP
ncbi:MAG: tetraacyldisaccharide 4'-kinase [Alphaproteobacteria bacterium]|nr:tetraacyldisaccharide 4'-kinase [Alphaproteobacteria bacterium]